MELVLGMFGTHAIMKDGHVRGAGPGKAEGGLLILRVPHWPAPVRFQRVPALAGWP